MELKKFVYGKSLREWKKEFPLMSKILGYQPVVWKNNKVTNRKKAFDNPYHMNEQKLQEAKERFSRFAPLLEKLFPETIATNGKIESELIQIPYMKRMLEQTYKTDINGNLFMKLDSHLPIAGSVKARGGIYEVLKHAESLAILEGLVSRNDNYVELASEESKKFFSNYTIAVGSTGNLGLSIGIISRALGFNVTVHMSKDAKEWKKELLREKGVQVIEYISDYSEAVKEGRKAASKDAKIYFVDDENSRDLFLGYGVAAYELKSQLNSLGITVESTNPLVVYIPCGVGGAPGGICFGLKLIFEHVKCIFVEPTHSPSMLLGMMTGLHDKLHVSDFGIDNITEADGLAVGSPSAFVGRIMEPLLDGIVTVNDQELFKLLSMLYQTERIQIEPSAAAGFAGPISFEDYKDVKPLHVVWGTGGALVPKEILQNYQHKRNFD